MVSCRAFERCLAGLDTTVGSRDSRESDPTPPPPPPAGGRGCRSSPGGAGLARAPVFPDRVRWWGRRFAPPPSISQTNRPILDPKTTFDSSNHKLSERFAKFWINVTDDITGARWGQFSRLNISHCPPHRAKQPYHIETNPMERHGSYLGCF